MSERVIGLTIVAIGTSLPELVTSVTAAKKGKTSLAVGNLIGSNIFNILLVAGVTSLIAPLSFPKEFLVDSLLALASAILLAALSYQKGHAIRRWGGVLLVLGFAAYYVYLFLGAFA